MTELGTDFELIETLRWSRAEGFPLIEAHLRRLARSSSHFGFACESERVCAGLQEHAAKFADDAARRVRLTLARGGELRISADLLTESAGAKFVVLSAAAHRRAQSAVSPQDDAAHALRWRVARAQREQGAYEVLFFNRRGELAEGSRTNVFLELDARLCTPPLAVGCLPGVMRAKILAERTDACERVLRADDLARANRIFVCNAVRGMVEVMLSAIAAVQHERDTTAS